jgi:diacylglycerol kinase family enzyme
MQDRPLAVLPLGTGNAFAHSLGMGSIEIALEALESGVERRIDVMTTTHPTAPVALVSISVGFESRFLRAAAASRRWRRIVSGARGLPIAMSRPWARSSLTVDGEPLVRPTERVFNSGLYGMPCYALGRVVLPEADPTDGRAEAVVYRSSSAYWRTLWRGVRFSQRDGQSDLSVRRWEFARLETDEPIQIDGESVAGGRLEVRVEPQALRVIVPRTVRRDATRK